MQRLTVRRRLPVLSAPTAIGIAALPSRILKNQVFTVKGNLYDTTSWIYVNVPGKTLHVSYDGVVVGDVVTGATGYSLQMSIPTVGTYRVRVDFDGDADYLACYHETPEFTVTLELPAYTTVNQIPAPNSTVTPPFSHARILARQSTGINRIEFVTWRTGEPALRVWLSKTGTQMVNGVVWEVWEGDVTPQTFETNYTGYFDIYANDGARKEYSFPYTIAVTPGFPWWIFGLLAGGVVLVVVGKQQGWIT